MQIGMWCCFNPSNEPIIQTLAMTKQNSLQLFEELVDCGYIVERYHPTIKAVSVEITLSPAEGER